MKTRHGPVPARAVVLAVQPHVAAALLDPDGDIRAPSVNVVFLEYIREQVGHSLDGLGFLSTKGSGRIISGAQFLSTMYEVRAPTGHVAISAYAGGAGNPELAGLDNATLVGKVDNELAELLDIKGAPVVCRTRRWALGPPQYATGYSARVDQSARVSERVPGLFITANFLRGISVANCLSRADNTVSRVAETLTGQVQIQALQTG